MDSKPWYASKTLWVNALALVGMIVQGITGAEVLDAEAQGGILALVNLVLRLVTKSAVTS